MILFSIWSYGVDFSESAAKPAFYACLLRIANCKLELLLYGEPVVLPQKSFSRGQVYGGLLFGLGWALTGACPGPLFAQIGTGLLVVVVPLLSAIGGTWVYGLLREKLPH